MSTSPDAGAAVAAELEALHHSDQRLVRSVDSLTEAQWRGASLLPDWTRAHVIAHLVLNAEAFAGALEGIDQGRVVPVYPSEAARDTGIATLAGHGTEEIRERLFAATTRFRDAVAGLTGSQWEQPVHRLPDGPLWPSTALPGTRRREVEIHHADLDTRYTHRDWPTDFAVDLLEQATRDQAAADGDAFSIRATDTGQTWPVGADEPLVKGLAADLGWWLVGRGHGAGLALAGAPDAALPRLGPWRRAPDEATR